MSKQCWNGEQWMKSSLKNVHVAAVSIILLLIFTYAPEAGEDVFRQSQELYSSGNYSEAVELLKNASDKFIENNELTEAASCFYRLGFLYDALGKFDQAMDAYGDGYQISQRNQNFSLSAMIAFNSAACSLNLGDAKKALQIYDELLRAFEAAGAEALMARCLQNRGSVLMQQGQVDQAYKDLTRAAEIYKEIGANKQLGEASTNLGVLFMKQNIYPAAKTQFETAEKIFIDLGDQRSLASVYTNQAELSRMEGEMSAALQLLENALRIKQESKDRMGEAAALQAIARILHKQEQKDEAKAKMQQAIYIRTGLKDSLGEGNCHLTMGQWLFEEGGQDNYNTALNHLARAREAFTKAGYRDSLQRVLYWEGRIAEAQGDFQQGEKKLKQAIEILESMVYQLPPELLKNESFDREKKEPYEALVALLIQQERLPEALSFLGRSQDQNLAKDLVGGSTEEMKFKAKMNALQQRIDAAIIDKNDKLAGMLRQEQEGAQKAYTQHVEDLFRHNPRLHALTQVKPDQLARLRRHLDDSSLMVQYLFFGDYLYLFYVTADSMDYLSLEMKETELSAQITYLRNLLEISFQFYPTSVEKMEELNPGWRANYDEMYYEPIINTAHSIYGKVVAPLEHLMKEKKRLIIVPHQSLHYLPFAMLVSRLDNGTPRFLIQDIEIVKQGNLTLLDFTQGNVITEDLKILAVGNADGTLPMAQDEAERMANVFPDAEILIGEEAREDVVKKHSEPKDILHLATHAFLDAVDQDKSYIMLAPSWDKGEDGKLWRREVLELGLNLVSLVTLSACQTALGEHTLDGDEIYGLEQSFVVAGAQTVISTLWPVEDKSTGMIMEQFYRNLSESTKTTEGGMKRASSLRKAQLALLDTGQYFHPYFWAPFVMTGNPD